VNVPIGVVIPAFRAERFLPRCLGSVAAQTLAPSEIVVVDDGSDDATAAVAERLGARVLRQQNRGPGAARNAGVAALGSQWVAFLDADDAWEPHALARYADAIRLAPDVRVIFGDYAVDEPGAEIASWFRHDPAYHAISRRAIAPHLSRCDRRDLVAALVRSLSFISTSSLAIRCDAFLAVGGFDEELKIAEDLDLLLRLFARSTAIAIDDVLSTYYKHGVNLSGDPLVNAEWELRVAQRVAASPERYPTEAPALLRAQRPERLLNAALYALRLGRFQEARNRFTQSWTERRSAACAAGWTVAAALDNAGGRAVHSLVRDAWRRARGTTG
jgi:glycosyltransferase involved in cell wall biosynthesis